MAKLHCCDFNCKNSTQKLKNVPSIFVFPQHLQRKPSPKSRTDPEERRRKQGNETPQTSKNKIVFNG